MLRPGVLCFSLFLGRVSPYLQSDSSRLSNVAFVCATDVQFLIIVKTRSRGVYTRPPRIIDVCIKETKTTASRIPLCGVAPNE
jgi:hypothetical protein